MRKRSKYRPKPQLPNPLNYVMESHRRITDHAGFLLDLRIKNSGAMVDLMQGKATRQSMDTLIAMSNVTEALHQMGFGDDYQDVCIDGRYAILKILDRAGDKGKFTPTGEEIRMLNKLMELHDAQMDVVTVRDVEKALAMVKYKIQYQKDLIKVSSLPAHVL